MPPFFTPANPYKSTFADISSADWGIFSLFVATIDNISSSNQRKMALKMPMYGNDATY